MTIISSGGYELSEREEQTFAIMSLIEDAMESDDLRTTRQLAGEILNYLDFEEEQHSAGSAGNPANGPANGPAKPRIRVPALQIV